MKAKEFLVAALAWTEVRRITKMPFADQRGCVAGVTQQRRQGRVIGRKAENLVAFGDRRKRLLRGAAQAILPATRDQRETRGRAHARVRIAAREQQALLREAIEIGRDVGRTSLRIASAEAAKIGVAEIVGQDVDEVRPSRAHLAAVLLFEPVSKVRSTLRMCSELNERSAEDST